MEKKVRKQEVDWFRKAQEKGRIMNWT